MGSANPKVHTEIIDNGDLGICYTKFSFSLMVYHTSLFIPSSLYPPPPSVPRKEGCSDYFNSLGTLTWLFYYPAVNMILQSIVEYFLILVVTITRIIPIIKSTTDLVLSWDCIFRVRLKVCNLYLCFGGVYFLCIVECVPLCNLCPDLGNVLVVGSLRGDDETIVRWCANLSWFCVYVG